MFDQNIVGDAYHEWVAQKPITFRSCWVGFGAIKDTEGECFSDCCRSAHPFGLRPGPRLEEGTMGWEVDTSLRPLVEHITLELPGDGQYSHIELAG